MRQSIFYFKNKQLFRNKQTVVYFLNKKRIYVKEKMGVIEILFSFVKRKKLTPNDSPDFVTLDVLPLEFD